MAAVHREECEYPICLSVSLEAADATALCRFEVLSCSLEMSIDRVAELLLSDVSERRETKIVCEARRFNEIGVWRDDGDVPLIAPDVWSVTGDAFAQVLGNSATELSNLQGMSKPRVVAPAVARAYNLRLPC